MLDNEYYLNKYLDEQDRKDIQLECVIGSLKLEIKELVCLYEALLERASSHMYGDFSEDIKLLIKDELGL